MTENVIDTAVDDFRNRMQACSQEQPTQCDDAGNVKVTHRGHLLTEGRKEGSKLSVSPCSFLS